MPLHSLYICYFGLREPLVQTQVLPYLRQLAAAGTKISLLTFEPALRQNWSSKDLDEARKRLAGEGIRWHYLAYHKNPSMAATLYDILAGARLARRLIREEGVQVLHGRAHLPMAMAMLAVTANTKLIFDVRGLMAEEYRDAGVWTEKSVPFRVVKKIERYGLKRADQVVVLTRRLRDWLIREELAAAEKIEVIPCCVNLELFARSSTGQNSRRSERFEVIYAGSLVGLYLVEEIGRFFMALKERQPNAFLRLLSVSPPEQGANQLRQAGLKDDDFWIGAVPAAEVPSYLERASLGISFRKSTFAQIAASPTKIPEYLAAGLPVVSNAGIGDTDDLLEPEGVGVIVREFTPEEFARASEVALALAEDPSVRRHCAEVARLHFDLQTVGGRGYGNVYSRLANLSEQNSAMKLTATPDV
ncbi:MAG TPA: glycosyltransferase [Pyrinomonadaceae bacterium]|nr:glycosyltransferase [Pyrinomonadaceae bacterium]